MRRIFNPNEENTAIRDTAEIISLVSTPPLVALVSIATLAYYYSKDVNEFWEYFLVGSFAVLGPALIYAGFRMLVSGRRKIDIDMTKRQDRIVPLMLAGVGAWILSYIIDGKLNGSTLDAISKLATLLIITLAIITTTWKISLHTTTYVTLVMFSTLFISPWMAIFLPGVLLIGWARYYLRKHTFAQLVGGSLLGIILPIVAKLVFYRF